MLVGMELVWIEELSLGEVLVLCIVFWLSASEAALLGWKGEVEWPVQ